MRSPWENPADPRGRLRDQWRQWRIPATCSCLTYGHGLSLTLVTSRSCPVHGKPDRA